MGELLCDHKLTSKPSAANFSFCKYMLQSSSVHTINLDYSVGPGVILCDFCAKIDFFA